MRGRSQLAPELRAELDRRVAAGESAKSLRASGFSSRTVYLTRLRLGKAKPRQHSNRDLQEKVRRLRVEENKSPLATAKELGICYQSVRMILKRQGFGPWVGRTASAVDWQPAEIEALTRLYPQGSQEEILVAIPGRNWEPILKKASSLGLKRVAHRKYNTEVAPILQQLRKEREERGWTRPQVAERAGLHPNLITVWELGKTQPQFAGFQAWVAAFGFELRLGTSFAGVSIDWDKRRVISQGRVSRLTVREWPIFEALARANGKILTKEHLHHELYGLDIDGGADPKIIDVFICKLRVKIAPLKIETHWGVGYSMEALPADLRPPPRQPRAIDIGPAEPVVVKALPELPPARVVQAAPIVKRAQPVSQPVPPPKIIPLPAPPPPPKPAPPRHSAQGDEAAIADFLRRKGLSAVPKVPGVGDPAVASLPPLRFDPKIRKATRRVPF